MGNWNSKISTKDKALLELKVQRDKLKQYEKKLQLVINRELEIAKQQLVNKNHHAARLALSKKKYQEQLLEKTGVQLFNIEQLANSIEYALVEQEILNGLEQGNLVLKEIHKETNLDRVEQILDDTADAIAYQNEIQDLLSNNLSAQDEQDILEQLDELIQLENGKQVELPSVPQHELVDKPLQQTAQKGLV